MGWRVQKTPKVSWKLAPSGAPYFLSAARQLSGGQRKVTRSPPFQGCKGMLQALAAPERADTARARTERPSE